MQANPYSPPGAIVADAPRLVPMRKPAGVWAMQGVAILVAGLCLLVLDTVVPGLGLRGLTAHAIVAYAIVAGTLVCALVAVVGSQGRRRIGRWCAVLVLAVVFVTATTILSDVLDAMNDPDRSEFTAEDIAMDGVAILSMVIALLLAWAYVFSRRCRAWFDAQGKPASP